MENKARNALLLVAILVLAFIIRLPGLSRPLYGDEADWLRAAKFINGVGAPEDISRVPDSPPGGKAVFALFYWLGFDNFRVIALIFGIASIAMAYVFASEIFGPKTALIAALLMALSAYHVIMSQHVDKDGAILPFSVLLVLYSHIKFARGGRKNFGWLMSALFFFFWAVLMRWTMAAILLPLFAYEYVSGGVNGSALAKFAGSFKKIIPYLLAGLLVLPAWFVLDGLFGYSTFSRTFQHYIFDQVAAYGGLGGFLVHFIVAAGRLLARVNPAMVFAALVSAWYVWKFRLPHADREEKAVWTAISAWLAFAAVVAAFATVGDPLKYFAITIPFYSIVVAHAISAAPRFSEGEKLLAVASAFLLMAAMVYLDYNEVNLLLLPWLGAAVALLAVLFMEAARDVRKLAAFLAFLSIITSLFMLSGYRMYDTMRSQSITDATQYFNSVGAQRMAQSQERNLDIYTGSVLNCARHPDERCVEQYEEIPHPVSRGYYVADFPLRPVNFSLPFDIGTRFRFNIFDESGVRNCIKTRTLVLHGVVVAVYYKC